MDISLAILGTEIEREGGRKMLGICLLFTHTTSLFYVLGFVE